MRVPNHSTCPPNYQQQWMWLEHYSKLSTTVIGLLKNLSAVILVRLVMARIRHVNQDYFQILLIIFLFLGVLTFCSHDYTLMPFLFILVSEDSYLIYIYIYDGFNIHVIQISCWWKLSCQILIHLGFWDWFYIIFKSVFDLRKY
jgi:hypothetical protein